MTIRSLHLVIESMADAKELEASVWGYGLAVMNRVVVELASDDPETEKAAAAALGLAEWVTGVWIGDDQTARVVAHRPDGDTTPVAPTARKVVILRRVASISPSSEEAPR